MTPTYFAQVDDENKVIAVHVVTKQFIDDNPDRYSGLWVETFTDAPGKTYAGIGYTYDSNTQDFIAPPIPKPVA